MKKNPKQILFNLNSKSSLLQWSLWLFAQWKWIKFMGFMWISVYFLTIHENMDSLFLNEYLMLLLRENKNHQKYFLAFFGANFSVSFGIFWSFYHFSGGGSSGLAMIYSFDCFLLSALISLSFLLSARIYLNICFLVFFGRRECAREMSIVIFLFILMLCPKIFQVSFLKSLIVSKTKVKENVQGNRQIF